MAASTTSPLAQQAAVEKNVYEARKKLTAVLDDEILDYKHGHPINIENCVTTLRRLLANVQEQPGNAKFRQVKASSNSFKVNITSQKGGEHFLMWAGWHTQVIDLQKFWMFDGDEGSTKMKILVEAIAVLDKAMHTIHEKAERKRQEQDGRKQRMLEERERIRLQIEEDKAERKLRNELTAHHGAVPASPVGAAAGAAAANSLAEQPSRLAALGRAAGHATAVLEAAQPPVQELTGQQEEGRDGDAGQQGDGDGGAEQQGDGGGGAEQGTDA